LNLTRIEIAGFKSFEHRLSVNFTGGITSVIGPNGCGKTNIVDAIRWVLGEQKTRLLRNTKMENVIFNGTRTRKPLSMAEVHLSLSNDDHALPVDYSEITVSRKIYRDGGSEYYVNGELARLKDIRGLLVDTGLGNHTYSIIEREMVDSVISEKDNDKRFLLEEAAGVMRYRIQREEALRKIEHTETDLTRLNDILAELDKEIRSLRYQMAKARRFARLKEKLETAEAALVKRSLFELLNETDEIRAEKERHEGITLVGDNEITLREDRLAELRIRGAELERRLQDLYENRHNLSQLLRQHEERIAILSERIGSNEGRIREDGEETERAKTKLVSLGEEIVLYRRSVEEKQELLALKRSELAQSDERLRAVSRRFETVKTGIRDRKQLILDFVKEKERVRGVREHLDERLREIGEKRTRIEQEASSLRAGEETLRARMAGIAGESERAHARAALLQRSIGRAAAAADRAVSVAARREESARRSAIELARLGEKTELLTRIKNEHTRKAHELFPEGTRSRGFLADRVKVDRKYRKCFEACLAPVMQALLTDSRDDALRCIEDLRRGVGGRVHLLYPNGGSDGRQDAAAAAALGTARDLLGEGDGVLEYLGPYLSGIAVAENVEAALSLLAAAPDLRVATLDGVFFDGPGRIIVAGAENVAMTLLEYESKIAELAEASRRCETRIARIRERIGAIEDRKNVLAGRATSLRRELEKASAEAERLREDGKRCELDLVVVREKIASLSAALAECDRDAEGMRNRLDATPELAGAPQEDPADGNDITSLERTAAELEREKEAAAEEAGRLRLDIATLSGELTTASEKLRNSESLDGELRELVVIREEDSKRCAAEIEGAAAEISDAKAKIAVFHREVEGIEREIENAKTSHDEIGERLGRLEKELKELKDERDLKRENIQRCTVDLATRETRIHDLVEKAREALRVDLDPYMRDRALFDAAEWDAVDVDALAQLRRDVEAFGPVNMLALEEFNQKKERFDFLSAQKADLEEAKAALTQAIRRINQEARRRISETFEQVRDNFKKTFLTLFDGGEADLLFVDSDDPLEAKIKLVANPKGKRLQDISSLSGGERALVALSLLFAIYLVKPSPFCVFDEVDAPLDDANVSRFIKLLKSFTDRTQFIVITHNKKTMEAADCLYGVTMEEPGVSKMISVHIGDVDRFRERRAARGAEAPAREEEPART
jgi:chromosome segregation protein